MEEKSLKAEVKVRHRKGQSSHLGVQVMESSSTSPASAHSGGEASHEAASPGSREGVKEK